MAVSSLSDLRNTAQRLWEGEEYQQCIEALQRLSSLEPGRSVQASSNLAVARHHAKQLDGRGLLEELSALKGQDGAEDEAALPLAQGAVLHSLGLSAMAATLLEALQDPSAHVSNADAMHACLLLIDIHLWTGRLDEAAGAIARAEQLSNEAGAPALPATSAAASDAEGASLQKALAILKVRHHVAARNMGTAELALQTLEQQHADEEQVQQLRAQVNCRQGDIEESVELLERLASGAEAGSSTGALLQAVANLGSVDATLGSHHLAAHGYLRAHSLAVNAGMEREAATLAYSAGVEALAVKQYGAAWQCLQAAAGLQQGRPQLWLRMAECCVGLAQQEQHAGSSMGSAEQASNNNANSDEASRQGRLLHAEQCLQTALHLLGEELAEADAAADDEMAAPAGQWADKAARAKAQRRARLGKMRSSALQQAAYVALALGDLVAAEKHAQDLLQVPGLSVEEECTARTYAAEALMGLGETSAAAEHLMQALQRVKSGAGRDGERLQAALLTNLAVACAALGDFEQAAALATRAGQLPGCACREQAELVTSFAALRMRDGHAAAS